MEQGAAHDGLHACNCEESSSQRAACAEFLAWMEGQMDGFSHPQESLLWVYPTAARGAVLCHLQTWGPSGPRGGSSTGTSLCPQICCCILLSNARSVIKL